MLPTLNLSGDVLLVDRVSTHLGNVSIGDVVLIQSPEDPKKIVTKRVTGLEGDSVTFLVNPAHGERSMPRTLVVSRTAQTVCYFLLHSMSYNFCGLQVPKDHVWVAGDNPLLSRDSRHFGSVPYGLIKGKAFCRVSITSASISFEDNIHSTVVSCNWCHVCSIHRLFVLRLGMATWGFWITK